jgi:hypothetical protein
MLYREVIASCSEIGNNHRNKVCGHSIEFSNTEPGGIWSTHWDYRVQPLPLVLFCFVLLDS